MTADQLRARAFRESFEMDYLGGPMFGLTGDALESAAAEFDARLVALLAVVADEAANETRVALLKFLAGAPEGE